MKLIVGLGNPGKKYQETWHNIGFMAVSQYQASQAGDNLEFKNNKKFKAEVCETGAEEKIILAKPQTFMNNSGQAIKKIVNFYKINPQDLWLIHDDIDLPLGKIRISHNSSAAGHKGIQSTIDELGTQEFVRFRIGIKPATPTKVPTEKYVLQKIAKADKVIVAEAIRMVLAAMEVSLAQGLTEAMNEFN